jgi:hypothetical protein
MCVFLFVRGKKEGGTMVSWHHDAAFSEVRRG